MSEPSIIVFRKCLKTHLLFVSLISHSARSVTVISDTIIALFTYLFQFLEPSLDTSQYSRTTMRPVRMPVYLLDFSWFQYSSSWQQRHTVPPPGVVVQLWPTKVEQFSLHSFNTFYLLPTRHVQQYPTKTVHCLNLTSHNWLTFAVLICICDLQESCTTDFRTIYRVYWENKGSAQQHLHIPQINIKKERQKIQYADVMLSSRSILKLEVTLSQTSRIECKVLQRVSNTNSLFCRRCKVSLPTDQQGH